ncbi:MAG: helix-turn-helix transcriptional regulator [Clostridia bacterium]|nr:helix-turn-helix transcriptional regulator [Clostridia bacterium]MBR4185072.1 helix-turn-helix transcriptional regulator [Clostridia bacterium]
MAAKKKLGDLIKEARTNAGMTQTALAAKIKGVTANDISKAERGEKELTKDQLKTIAKITGVTQKSLLDAASGTSTTASAAKKKTSTASSAKKKTSSAKTPAAATSSMKLTATEKKLVEAYRAADTKTRKNALNILKGTDKSTASIVESFLTGILTKEISEEEVEDEPVIYTVEKDEEEGE